ncbi:class I adenylate-forming enzyme family protein [Aquamicrobium soli]|uniref:Class I adenylate-forming enzyme family protein n=1 Tax=Aquamicrobium soli TaxID=1811518 RepID=A0ABV7KD83_9HYPH
MTASMRSMLLSLLDERAEMVEHRTQTATDLKSFANAVIARADELRDAGISGAAIVACRKPLDYLCDIFALWETGTMAVTVNPAITPEERRNVVAATGASALLDDDGLNATGVKTSAAGPLGPDDPALVLMTSGTTGRPKGIVHTQRSLSARVSLNLSAIGAGDLQRSLCVLPLHFGHGMIGNVFTVLAAGGRLVLWPQPGLDEIGGFGPLVDAERLTFMSSTPTFWTVAMRLSPRPAQAMRRVHVGSAPLSLPQWRAIAEWTGCSRVFNMYGMTETANWFAAASLEEADAADGLVGRPWGGAVAVLCEDGGVRREGVGEILAATPSMMNGYLGMEEETSAAFHGAWLRTGDTGRIDAAGRITLVGRIKNEINRGGVKIPAEEIDMLLERHPQVREACAFAIPDPVAGEAVAAAVVGEEGLDIPALRAWCRERCRAEAVPMRLFVMTAIPRNDRGKIVRARVREAALASGPGA